MVGDGVEKITPPESSWRHRQLMRSHADPGVRMPPPIGIGLGNRHRVAKQKIDADVDAFDLSRGAVIGDPVNITRPRGTIIIKVPTAGTRPDTK